MRYIMKQKLFAIGNDFTIKDENEQDRYFVDGKVFTIGKKFSFQDMQKKELARIEQKLLSWKRTFNIFRGSEIAATVSRDLFSFFKPSFTITTPGTDTLTVGGSFTQREFEFRRNGNTVATVSKQFFTWSDTYGVDVADGEDDVLILSAVVVIDMICHEKK